MFQRLSVLVFLFLFVISARAEAQTAEEIIGKYVVATGGIEKWKSVQTLMVVHRSAAFSFDLYWKKPNRVKVQVPVEYPEPGLDIRSFDGTTGWRINPMEGSEKPRRMAGDETLELLAMADGYFWFLDYKTKGYTAEARGKETIEGKPAYKVKLTRPVGTPQVVYFDSKTFLEIRRVITAQGPDGDDLTIVTGVGDYRSVGGLLLPHRVGNAVREYKINPPMDDAEFKMPGGGDDLDNRGTTGDSNAHQLPLLSLTSVTLFRNRTQR